jgi:hypothetical protein
MSTTTPTRAAAPRQSATVRALRQMLRAHLRVAFWFWGVMVAGIVIALAVGVAMGDADLSRVQFARQAGIWFPFSLMIMLGTVYLPVHVAAGMTRRAFSRAALASALVLAASFAVVMSVLMQLERFFFSAQGWTHRLSDTGFAATSSEPLRLLVDYLLTFSAGTVCGLLVGATYYRFGGWWGTLALPLTVGPIFVVIIVLAGWTDLADRADLAGWGGLLDPGGDPAALVLRAGLCALVVACVGSAFVRVVRRTQIAPVTT